MPVFLDLQLFISPHNTTDLETLYPSLVIPVPSLLTEEVPSLSPTRKCPQVWQTAAATAQHHPRGLTPPRGQPLVGFLGETKEPEGRPWFVSWPRRSPGAHSEFIFGW